MSADKVVETFPRPPAHYKVVSEESFSAENVLSEEFVQSLRDQTYSGLFSESSLTFVKAKKEFNHLPHSSIKGLLIDLANRIVLQAGQFVNLQTVDPNHLNDMKMALMSLLEEFHALLSHLRRREATVNLIQKLEEKKNTLKTMHMKLERYDDRLPLLLHELNKTMTFLFEVCSKTSTKQPHEIPIARKKLSNESICLDGLVATFRQRFSSDQRTVLKHELRVLLPDSCVVSRPISGPSSLRRALSFLLV